MLAHLLLDWVLSAFLLLLIAQFLPGFQIAGVGSALIAVIVVGLINATLGLFLRIITFPLTLLTFGLFLLVINAIVLKIAAALMPGFSIRGFLPAFVAAILLSLLHILLRYTFQAQPFFGHPVRV
jgi:putative membrane protein